MKNLLKIIGLVVVTSVVFTACSSDDNPVDNTLFAGTYEGSISYESDDTSASSDDGSVFVTKIGDSYTFDFSNSDIPNISGIEFEENEGTYSSLGSDESSYIRISESSLNILYTVDGQLWTADCTR